MHPNYTNLYLLTVKRGNKFYVLAEHPTDAQMKLRILLDKAGWWYSSDRDIVSINLLAKEIGYFPEDKPSFVSDGTDLIL